MSRLLAFGDLHCDRHHLRGLIERAVQERRDAIVSLGDLCYMPSDQEGRRFLRSAAALLRRADLELLLVDGNHDDAEALAGAGACSPAPGPVLNRQNVRRRLLVKAVAKANEKLVEAGIEPIGRVSPHGLRRTFASLRVAAGDDPVYVSSQLGHEDPTFTLKVYARVVKHRERLTPKEREAFEQAVEWAQMGTNAPIVVEPAPTPAMPEKEKPAVSSGF